ncbi:phenylacetic acid degradation protein [Nocardioides marmoriginsengisoli]|uniref:Phenylacetic acid degradation protein n=1 Tax=Nocardioides marmoriginsengisoli TaxID=661483 RepID=A0A3N0CI65_9ACTN|nr:fatty acid desaturase [Nocardioides marmoriginsengisoli]RNL63168.1 phenylacetic acid degradation protein [Nocardioides marmoriginsengisoli]
MSQTALPPAPQPVLGLPDPGEKVPQLAWPTAALYAGTLALFAAEAYGVLAGDWSRWLTVPIGAAVTFLMFSVLHESTHHAISTNTRVNDAFGHLSMPFVVLWTTFPVVKFIHIEHHRNTNEPMTIDPDNWTSAGPAWQLPLRWATIDLWYLVFYLKGIAHRPRQEAALALTTFVVVIAGMTVGMTTGYAAEILWLYLIPQRIGLVVLAWWFDYLPHHGLTVTQRENKYQATRVRVGGEFWLTPLFVYQNYHLVHHLHPSVPFYRYVRAWRRNEQAYLDRNAAISTWFGRSLTPTEYRTWRRLTDDLGPTPDRASAQRPVFHPLRVRSVARLTEDSTVVTFDVPADLEHEYRYVQGQHITLRAVIDGADVRRSYSIIEPVSANTLRVAVKRIEGGVFSTYVHRDLVADDILDVMSPTGRFHLALDASARRSYVAVAAGSGITPLMSIIATTLEAEPESTFTLVYGNRTPRSAMFGPQLDALAGDRLTVHHVLSRTPGAPLEGRVTAELVHELAPHDVDAWFLCGPQELVDSLSASIDGTVLTEVFHTEPSQVEVGVDIESQVTVALDGVETTFGLRSTGDTILDAAMQQGLEPPYSCAGGACGTCRAKVLLGKAVMDQNHALDEDEIATGYVLTCQAHPVSEELRIDYDA